MRNSRRGYGGSSIGSKDPWLTQEAEHTGGSSTMRFPLPDYASSDEKFPGTVEFLAIKTYVDKNTVGKAKQLINTQATGLTDEQTLNFVGNLADAVEGGKISPPKHKIAGRAVLYMPPGFEIQDGVQYDNYDFNLVREGARQLTQAVTNGGFRGGAQAVQNGIGSVLDAITRGGSQDGAEEVFRKAAAIGANYLPGLGEAVRAGAQMRSNPNTQSVFQGVAMRTFSFNFKMQPTSEPEAEQIRRIVKFFRYHMYPEQVDRIFYKFPTKFLVTLRYKNKILEPAILPCFLTGATTNYNGETGTFFKDGNPTQTDLTLSFQEERTINRGDIAQGY